MEDIILSLYNIYKKYDSTDIIACNNINLDIFEKEILTIIGENGAGKTTLVKIIAGIEKYYDGSIDYKNKKDFISIVQQHDRVFYEFTVLENIILGSEPTKYHMLIDIKKSKEQIASIQKMFGFDFQLNTKVKYLNNLEIKKLLIIKALYKKSHLIIFDEPTATMSSSDSTLIYNIILKLRDMGITIIVITHKIKEMMSITNRIAIMKNGRLNYIYNRDEVNENILKHFLISEKDENIIKNIHNKKSSELENEKTVFEAYNILYDENMYRSTNLNDISISVDKGECVAVVASDGNGLVELEDILCGKIIPTKGTILYNGSDIKDIQKKIHLPYIPSQRMKRGVSLNSKIYNCAIIAKRYSFSKFGFFLHSRVKKYTKKILNFMDIKAKYNQYVNTLSGGNIQRLILSREIDNVKDYILLAEPTQGVDTKTSLSIYQKIIELKNKNVAILLLTSNIDEAILLADRIIILYRGEIIKSTDNKDINANIISKYMGGNLS